MKQSASHPVCRAAKSLPVGIWHPSVMQFYSGPLIHFLSGVDTCQTLDEFIAESTGYEMLAAA